MVCNCNQTFRKHIYSTDFQWRGGPKISCESLHSRRVSGSKYAPSGTHRAFHTSVSCSLALLTERVPILSMLVRYRTRFMSTLAIGSRFSASWRVRDQRSQVTLDSRISGSRCSGFSQIYLLLEVCMANHASTELISHLGNPENITLTGVSAGEPHFLSDLVLLIQKGVHKLDDESIGAHSVHQILHHASHLPQGERAPFVRAQLQSNAMVFVCCLCIFHHSD